jgi:transcriptional regulator with XRE-family HTH domain
VPSTDPDVLRERYRVGDRLQRLRTWRGLTQEQLEEASGIAKRTLTRYERGHRGPGLDQLVLLARALGVPLVWLLGDEDLPPA